MKIAYLLEWEFDNIDGVIQKVLNQADIWRSFGHEVQIFALSKTKSVMALDGVNNYQKTIKNLIYAKELYRDLDSFDPDIVYFRYSNYKPYLSRVFKKYISILELNTNNYNEYNLQKYRSMGDLVSFYLFLLTDNRLQSKIKGIVSVTYEIANDIKLPYIVIPNSINLDNYTNAKLAKNSDTPNLVFIGTPNNKWHGVDKIYKLAKLTEKELNFHIIGVEKDDSLNLPNVKFYGYLNRDQYENILINSDIGIGTLAMHRINMNEACPLKVREYLALRLPTIVGYKDTAFLDKNLNWLLELENIENSIENSIEKIVDFCNENRNKVLTYEEVSEFIDSKVLEKKRLDFLQRIMSGKV